MPRTLLAGLESPSFHVAQVNIARPKAPVDSPLLADFKANLDPVNAIADAAPGFVWRLQDESRNATAIAFNFKQRFGPPDAAEREARPSLT